MGLRTRVDAAVHLSERLMPARAYVEGALPGGGEQPRFVILTSGRSGSELLVTLLNSHPQIACDGELLLEHRRWPERFIEGRAARFRRSGMVAYGIKVLPAHVYDTQEIADAKDWVRHLSAKGWKVIRLSRANRLHQAISMVRANHTQWHFRQGQAGDFQPVHMDPMEVVATLYVTEWVENQVTELLTGVEHLSFCYEDDLENPEEQAATVAKICGVLGLEPAPTSTDLVRINPRRAQDMVTNFDEIRAELLHNRFADYAAD
jgi:LPS sulfotransferase NodH